VFCEKRLQTIENKGQRLEKECKETQRGGKLLKKMDLPQRHGDTELGEMGADPTHPGDLERCENKGVAEKGIWKVMKTKVRPSGQGRQKESG